MNTNISINSNGSFPQTITSSTFPLSAVSNLLESLLSPLRHDTIHGFLFTSDPIHVGPLSSPYMTTRAIQGQYVNTQECEYTKKPLSTMKLTMLYLPVLSLPGVTLGVGGAYYDMQFSPGTFEYLPPHSYHDMRFCLTYDARRDQHDLYLLHYGDGEIPDTDHVTVIHSCVQHRTRKILESVATFSRQKFYELTTFSDMSIPLQERLEIQPLLPHLLYLSQTELSFRSLSPSSPYQPLLFSNNDPVHPFDDRLFKSLMCTTLGSSSGLAHSIVFDKCLPTCTFTNRTLSSSTSFWDVGLVSKLRDESLTRHAHTIRYSPLGDTPLRTLARILGSNSENNDDCTASMGILPEPEVVDALLCTGELEGNAYAEPEKGGTSPLSRMSGTESGLGSLGDFTLDQQTQWQVNEISNTDNVSQEEQIGTNRSVTPVIGANSSEHVVNDLNSVSPPPLISLPSSSFATPSLHGEFVQDRNSPQNSPYQTLQCDDEGDAMFLSASSSREDDNNDGSTGQHWQNSNNAADAERIEKRRKMLLARRERNRASARVSNERRRQARLYLENEVETAKLQVATLREREAILRAENIQLRKQIYSGS